MTMYTYPDYMYHYGVIGMKWGQRKQRKRKTRDYKKASKNRRNLSDKELDARIERLKKEKQLRTLTEEEINPGRTMVKNQLKKVGAAAAVGAMVLGARYAVTGKAPTSEEIVGYVLPNPNKKK